MRDRLIELIKANGLTMIYLPIAVVRKLADHLLKNGVIVPPCKEGDTVYCVWKYDKGYSDGIKEFVKRLKRESFVLCEFGEKLDVVDVIDIEIIAEKMTGSGDTDA